MKNRKLLKIFAYTILILFIGISVKADTTTSLHFCEYRGTIRTMKIIGIFIIFAKTIVPIVLIYKGIKNLTQVVISGKQDEMKGSVSKLAKSVIAGLVVFFIPTIVNYLITFVSPESSDTDLKKCSDCILKPERCKIPKEDPKVSERD